MMLRCCKCKGTNVQLSYPVWVDANDQDNREKWEMDDGAQPWKDSDKTWCHDCQEHTGVEEVGCGTCGRGLGSDHTIGCPECHSQPRPLHQLP